MAITKNIVSKEEAKKLAPDYVKFVLNNDDKVMDKILHEFNKLKKGQTVLTYTDGVFVRAKVSSINSDCLEAQDGPVIRVSNGEFSWRVDGDKYAFPL